MIFGLMGAMPEEIENYISLLSEFSITEIGGRKYHSGKIAGINVVIVFSKWGKVAAASTVSTLINHFKITELIFTGVAGAIHHSIKIGDVVIAKRLVQHDVDARPLFNQFEIPLTGISYFITEDDRINFTIEIITLILKDKKIETKRIESGSFEKINLSPNIHVGDIASGDKFFSSKKDKDRLINELPSVLCVEMEGAAVAQVCYEYNLPFTIVRVISDNANEEAPFDFNSFVNYVSAEYFLPFIKLYFKKL
ncbi:MAG: 5'-methylthioadenosine/adenosylhomocysteine nucleosidase [Bacteroidota bacterium]|jgi:adenosylhomocysteine nucleosidase